MKYPIRRAQLISPFGPGAMSISKNGISAVCSGLDHWFKDRHGKMDSTDLSQYKIKEWRLERMLGVDHFRLPPDFRTRSSGDENMNMFLTVPFLRFPKWHYCTFCGQMNELQYYEKKNELCKGCEEKGYRNYLVQAPFISICEKGHLQDFPWREWVHKKRNPSCEKTMFLVSTGGGALTTMQVRCGCGVEPRMLQGITSAYNNGKTELSESLCEDGTVFLCQGKRPWLGNDEGVDCTCHLRASLRSASNVYFAQVRSAIYIPGNSNKQISELLSFFEQSQVLSIIKLAKRASLSLDETVYELKEQFLSELSGYPDSGIRQALIAKESRDKDPDSEAELPDDMEAVLRQEEYEVLNSEINQEELKIKPVPVGLYKNNIFDISKYFSNIHLVEKLKETRVLTGFNRVFNDQQTDIGDMKSMLWRKQPEDSNEDWLPAYVVFGEGIFFNFNEEIVREWEERIQVSERSKPLSLRYRHLVANRRTKEKKITPRFIMAHTFAHIIINQLVFECGYSSSSLRERLYVSDNDSNPMCGVLIYTAAGDSDGTMGGLVRMGKPGYLEAVIRKAFNDARWCSTDPVCTEIGLQGPDSCNLAACHSCSLLPETACEEFNRFLDRGLIVPLHGVDPSTAFFN
ncbi:DUF1998 domain-containing protein [Paenibacillus typhae]|uniref:DUF1998 domain-containing protein n=1 Tax=Paenibacillus typhae TaxID=1174501 RepID=UPI001C8EC24C|nr:DUF1998 domain-containing protein [Paenibacillus typhae]MBY0011633.1 DUF1998 domain-containing protein [Paenibacillus typhae]